MKLPLFSAFLVLSLPVVAAEKKAALAAPAVEADPLAAYPTADDLWKHLEELQKEPTVQPKSREEYLAVVKSWFGGQRTTADAFLKKYPADPHRFAAQIITIQAARQLARLPGADAAAKVDATEQRKQIDAILAAPEAPAEVKGEATFVRAMTFTEQIDAQKPETASAFLQASEEFLTKYPSHPLGAAMRKTQLELASDIESPETEKLLNKAADAEDARIAEAAKRLLTKRQVARELKSKPVALKFAATDGREIDLEKLRGKVVLLDFWASWCGPCIAEMPNVVATYGKLHDKGFEVLGISLDQEKEAMDATVKKLGMTWPQYFDGKGWQNAISTSFGIQAIPAAWLIDKKGMLRGTGLRGEALVASVEKLLAE